VRHSYFRFHFYSSHSIIVSTFSSLVREVSCFLQLPPSSLSLSLSLSPSFNFSSRFLPFIHNGSLGFPPQLAPQVKPHFYNTIYSYILFSISCDFDWGFLIQIALLKVELRLIDLIRVPFKMSFCMLCVCQLVFQTGDGTFPRWPSECWKDFSCQFNCCELLASCIAIYLIYKPWNSIFSHSFVLLSWPRFHIALMFRFVYLQTGGYSEDMIPTVCIFGLFITSSINIYVWRLWACFSLYWNVILGIIKPRLGSTWEK